MMQIYMIVMPMEWTVKTDIIYYFIYTQVANYLRMN